MRRGTEELWVMAVSAVLLIALLLVAKFGGK